MISLNMYKELLDFSSYSLKSSWQKVFIHEEENCRGDFPNDKE